MALAATEGLFPVVLCHSRITMLFVCRFREAETIGFANDNGKPYLTIEYDVVVLSRTMIAPRIKLEVSEELGIAQSVISRLWQRFQDDGNVSRCYRTGRPRVTTPNEDRYILAVTAKRNRRSTASDLSRQLSSATGTTVSRQTVYRRLGHIGLYARRPRAPGTRYHQENTIERHRYSGAGWLVCGGIILGSKTYQHVQSVTRTGHIYRDVILEQHVRLFRGAMGAEFLFMDDNARPHRANIADECLQS
ncbi:transposable element Tcb1 transposase [Trichonephila clavipes]|uniref:Transposable element Tcb1 transposase n=1 Tax=Trichonephila clavipes TaxID=2585209 RepID=A0A8X6SJK5_TRICX|nr:transposable element Tcb1 transposase [Trichonephila clavipes]